MDDIATLRHTRLHGLVGNFYMFLLGCALMNCVPVLCADRIPHQTNITNRNIYTTAGPRHITDICPGVEYLTNNNITDVELKQVNVSDCENDLSHFTESQGAVYGTCGDSTTFCRLHITVPQSMLVLVHIQRLSFWCDPMYWKTVIIDSDYVPLFRAECEYDSVQEKFIVASTNHMFLSHLNVSKVKIDITAIKVYTFLLRYASMHSGYVKLPFHRINIKSSKGIRKDLITSSSVIMLSFQTTWNDYEKCKNVWTELIYNEPNRNQQVVVRVCDVEVRPAKVFFTSRLQFYVSNPHTYFTVHTMKFIFSFHSETERPPNLASGLFNCSVDYYPGFQHHLECNLKTECENEQDETEHCLFSSASCQGLVTSRNKCFKYIRLETDISAVFSAYECQKMGGELASIKTRREQKDLLPIFEIKKFNSLLIGYTSGWNSVPFMYSKFRKWSDNTLIYNMNHIRSNSVYSPSRIVHALSLLSLTTYSGTSEAKSVVVMDILCEVKTQTHNKFPVQTVQLPLLLSPKSIFTQTAQVLSKCTESHVMHTFLSCERDSYCGETTHLGQCVFLTHALNMNSTLILPEKSPAYRIAMFKCDDDMTTVSYTLTCDFRQDCPDNSDESFCEHSSCNGFLCTNDQCVLISQRCNELPDCLDDSDEMDCLNQTGSPISEADKKYRLFINVDGTGYFTQHIMKANKSCPGTHFHCTTEWLYCLPVYTRCNGFSDCSYGEDEQDCESLTWSGFYQCRASTVHVHGDHLCDGWGQCPRRDDEWLCDMTCPEGCLCQGCSFLCSVSFLADLFPRLCYLDAAGSGMTLNNLSNNTYLISLSLSYCSLTNISSVELPNLQFLDLSNNKLVSINMDDFIRLLNLRTLIIGKNPLTSLKNTFNHVYYTLRTIDLPETQLEVFDVGLSIYFLSMNNLNLSFSSIKTIESTGFKCFPQLKELDVRGNIINDFPLNVLSGLHNLRSIFTSNYRFCCKTLLPKHVSEIRCLAPEHVLSMCQDIFPNKLFKIVLLLVGLFIILGTSFCFMASLVIDILFGDSFMIATVNLHFANMCMGIYVIIIIVANEIFLGQYIYFEKTWTSSFTCKMAGVLSLLSSEVSVLILWFITLDYIVILCFPLTRWKFNKGSMAVACAVAWIVGTLLSVIPFLSGLSHWGLDIQSGLCHLALSDQDSSSQRFKWFTVIVTFDCILCFSFMAGQMTIYRHIPKYRICVDSTNRTVYSSAYLLIKLAVTDAVCWFSIGLTIMLGSSRVAESDKINMFMNVFMLPFRSALSPFLYMWTVAIQRRQQAQQIRLLQALKLRLKQK